MQCDPFAAAADLFDPPFDADREVAQRLTEDFGLFIREAWPIVEPATDFVHGWHIDVVAEHLTAVSNGELKRLIINVPPRTMKSLETSVFWPAWEWMESPHLRWLFASYAGALSVRDSLKMRRLVESKGGKEEGTIFERIGYQGALALLHDDPWKLQGDQNAKTKYDTTATGFRLATSVGAMVTGEGGDRVVVDDPINPEQARSDVERETANRWWDETMTTRFNNDAAAGVIVMQRLHEDDLTGHLIEQGGWHHLCLPAEYERKHPFVYPKTIKTDAGTTIAGDPREVDGQLLEPVRLSAERLTELRRGLGSYGFAGQMQQRPAPEGGGMFKAEWWKRYEPDQIPHVWQNVVASWDMRFSDSQSAQSSFVVGQVWGINGVQRYLLGQIRAKLSFTDSVKAVQAMANWMPDARSKLIEKKANGAAVIDTLSATVSGMIPIEPEGGKEVRAAACEPLVEAGNVFLPAGQFIPAPAGYEPTPVDEFIGEHSAFPNGQNDDQVDAMTQVLNWLHNKAGTVSTESYMGKAGPSVVRDGDLTLVGDHHVDKP